MENYIYFVLAGTSVPVLIGEKPACFINFSKKICSDKSMFHRLLFSQLSEFELQYKFIWESAQSYYVFIYNACLLEQQMKKYRGHILFAEYEKGLITGRAEEYLDIFQGRYALYRQKRQSFPDEIGILLGYPRKDVEAYVAKNGKDYLFIGYWKVYGNVEQAIKTFSCYKIWQLRALNWIAQGYGLKKLHELER